MAVIVCPIGSTLSFEMSWPSSARSLTDCSGLSQIRTQPSGEATLLMDGTVTIDDDNRLITITFDPDDTGDMDEGSRGYMDLRLEWTDGEVQYPLQDEIVEIEFTPTVTREAA